MYKYTYMYIYNTQGNGGPVIGGCIAWVPRVPRTWCLVSSPVHGTVEFEGGSGEGSGERGLLWERLPIRSWCPIKKPFPPQIIQETFG